MICKSELLVRRRVLFNYLKDDNITTNLVMMYRDSDFPYSEDFPQGRCDLQTGVPKATISDMSLVGHQAWNSPPQGITLSNEFVRERNAMHS